eukprot:6206977-Pleurochrysis_carterae.AAC.1
MQTKQRTPLSSFGSCVFGALSAAGTPRVCPASAAGTSGSPSAPCPHGLSPMATHGSTRSDRSPYGANTRADELGPSPRTLSDAATRPQ